jgi:hypothetical protein
MDPRFRSFGPVGLERERELPRRVQPRNGLALDACAAHTAWRRHTSPAHG